MQLDSSSNSRPEQPVGLFMPPSNMASLQGGLAQELAQSVMFASQNGVASLQTTTSSPVQQPGTLFHTAVSGSISQPSQPQQPGMFLFGIQNGKKLITRRAHDCLTLHFSTALYSLSPHCFGFTAHSPVISLTVGHYASGLKADSQN